MDFNNIFLILVFKRNMASQNLVYCSKCGNKHSRPVGNRCKRMLNTSAPAVAASQENSVSATHLSSQKMDRRDTGSNPNHLLGEAAHSSKTDNVDTKLDLILRKMQDLEEKNEQLERKINQQEPIVSSSRFSHSSPAREGKSSRKAGDGESITAKMPDKHQRDILQKVMVLWFYWV